jgi:tetratricopeptide (TPR) repeat protein
LAARANLKIGGLYDKKGDYDLALHHAVQSLNGFRKIEDNSGIFGSNNQIADIYWRKDEIEEAKKYNEKCLKRAESQKMIFGKLLHWVPVRIYLEMKIRSNN